MAETVPPTAQRKIKLRHTWLLVHRLIGLTAGLLLALIGLSGALLVLNERLVRFEASETLMAGPLSGPWRPVSEWIANAERRFPELAPFESVHDAGSIPLATSVPVLFKHLDGGPRGEGHGLVAIDPTTGEPLGFVLAEDTVAGTILLFHMELLSHEVGQLIVSLTGVIGLVSIASGAYLWWPAKGRWSQSLRLRRNATGLARFRDLHNVPAAWLLVPAAIVIFTGVYLHQPSWVDPMIKPFSDIRELQDTENASSPQGACAQKTTLDQAIALALEIQPEAVVRQIWLPSEPRTPYFVELRARGTNPRASGTGIWVDQNCPKRVSVRKYQDLTAAETLKAWLWPIHTDLGLGIVGQCLVFLSGILLPFLFVTGIIMWQRRR